MVALEAALLGRDFEEALAELKRAQQVQDFGC
jgi:hypothetical protein